jgi:predicted nuclease of restriction endonuclease-like (RecB) superfamily
MGGQAGDAVLMNDSDYIAVVGEVKARIDAARRSAARALNRELVTLYWSIGKLIDERNRWGQGFIDNLSRDIRLEYPQIRGFSPRNLRYMQRFAQDYPDQAILQSLPAELSWTHHVTLLGKVSDHSARLWYAAQAAEDGWSVRALEDRIERQLYERQALPHKITNFENRLPGTQAERATHVLRDPYLFDFICYRDGMVEREVEDELVRNVTKLLLELGTGFAFVGQQYPIEVEGEDFAVDLLFYHLKLRCYVVVELKNGRFKPEYAGQLNFYVSAVDATVASELDEPTIGLLLCRDKRGLVAEYAFKDINKPMGISEYRLLESLPEQYEALLPSPEDIKSRMALPEENDASGVGAE